MLIRAAQWIIVLNFRMGTIVSKPHMWEDRPLDSEMIHFQFLISLFIFYFIAVVVSYVGKRLFI